MCAGSKDANAEDKSTRMQPNPFKKDRVLKTANLRVRANSGKYESLYFIINNQIMVNTCQYLVMIMYSTIQSQYYNPHHQLRSVRHL
jgi:hypothetical protein